MPPSESSCLRKAGFEGFLMAELRTKVPGLRKATFFEGCARGFGRLLGSRAPVQQGGGLGGEQLLGFVEFLTLQRLKTLQLFEWQHREEV